MSHKFRLSVAAVFTLLAASCFWLLSCNNNNQPSKMSHDQMVEQGKYLVQTIGCGDCHTPKKFTSQGPVPDESRLLSGFNAAEPLPPFDTALIAKGIIMTNGELTAWAGPWGISFSANITPDSTTGIGGFDETTFINTIRDGKYHGVISGRSLLPPMPWQNLKNLTDNDMQSIFAYLQSIPPIHNQVPAPIPPNEIGK